MASLVPAATDLILGMGLGDRLVGVSTFDRSNPEVGNRPAVGDYLTVDWERLAQLHPTCMIVQIAPDRLPAGFKQRADALHIQLIDVQIERLQDIAQAIDTLMHALDVDPLAARLGFAFRLRAVRDSVQQQTPVRTLLVLDEAGTAVAGAPSFLDDVLQLAGGTNVAASLGNPWPTIDDETLQALKPDAVIVLLPGASPQSVAQAKANWARRTRAPAVAAGRVQVITAWYALLPGWHVADLAESIARCLHPQPPTSRPSTGGPPGG